jgi:hypothetical protein
LRVVLGLASENHSKQWRAPVGANNQMRSMYLLPLLAIGCLSGNLDANVSKEIVLSEPVSLPSIADSFSFSTTLDLTQDIKQFDSLGKLSITVNSNEMSLNQGTFEFMNSLQISVGDTTIISHTFSPQEQASNSISLVPENTNNLFEEFAAGPATITVSIVSNNGTIVPEIDDTVSLHFDVAVKK